MSRTIRTVVLGASGYVGGELLRLLANHPCFTLTAAVSDGYKGRPIGEIFPHVAPFYADNLFVARNQWLDLLSDGAEVALFSAAPHGAAAELIAAAVSRAKDREIALHVVDSSADFRFTEQSDWEAIYGLRHGAPELLDQFTCGVPEHVKTAGTPHIGHPGCFATAVLLAAVPLMQSGLSDADLYVSGVTGSTGSGRSAQAGTHHPERNSNFYSYKPLAHRHAPEIARLAQLASGRKTNVHFVPHSGPFARGIHVTLQAKLNTTVTTAELTGIYRRAYEDAPFVEVLHATPRIKNVVASNYCHLNVATNGDSVVVMTAIDNLVKGAAGGAIQWMNRLWNIPETTGISAAAPGWT